MSFSIKIVHKVVRLVAFYEWHILFMVAPKRRSDCTYFLTHKIGIITKGFNRSLFDTTLRNWLYNAPINPLEHF